VAGAGLAAGWRLAGSRHFPAMNWLGGLGWLVAFRPWGGWDAADTSRCPAGWQTGWDTAGISRCPAGWQTG